MISTAGDDNSCRLRSGRITKMLDHVSPECILRAVDVQLRSFITSAFGEVDAEAAVLAELKRTTTDTDGTILGVLIRRYNEIVEYGVFTDDMVLRYAVIVRPIRGLSRSARCTVQQLRAALALLDATAIPGHAECLQVVACRSEIEADLIVRSASSDIGHE